jgi:AhpD family alkylhydroperoxidase
MAHVEPKNAADLEALAPVLAASEATMGFVPNSMLTMAHMPQLTMAFSLLAGTVFGGDLKAQMAAFADHVPDAGESAAGLPPTLVQLIAFSVSVAAGCRYCQAHTGNNFVRFGADAAKLAEVLRYEQSQLLDDAEKAAVALALAAGAVPNESNAAHFEALRGYFDERQITQIVAVIALFGFLNRWNDTMATRLEAHPVAFAETMLGAFDWTAGKHG